jgi:murein DD-endopeptidase MepM/ murein hydrolase activator NlpD
VDAQASRNAMPVKGQRFLVFEARKAGFNFAAGHGDIALAGAMQTPLRNKPLPTWRTSLANLDLTPDLGENIGSFRWFRGLGTLTLLCAFALALLPDFGPLYGAQPPLPTESEFEESRAQMIMPLAFGGDSGRRMAANENVVALSGSPERPTIEMTATLGRGDSFSRVLQRAGVGSGEASRIESMVSGAVNLSDISAGTPMEITLGARSSRSAARPLESLAFRARFDLNVEVARNGGALQLIRKPIKVDDTPLRIHGAIGSGLYNSARAAGAPAAAIQNYLQIIAGRTNLSNLRPSDQFDIIIDYRRAETGEIKTGDLLYAGLDRDGKSAIQMLKWQTGGSGQWFEASGVGETRGQMGRPVNGRITSGFGMRRHPILGYVRMHAGIDFGAPYGTPIFAASDGKVGYAGRKGGNGNYVQIQHGGGIASGYSHMSRIAAGIGQFVRRGQIIGYVGSTGLSTGSHLHYSLFRNGTPINPLSIKFTSRAQLAGADLANFRAKLARLKSVAPGSALGSIKPASSNSAAPQREIDKISRATLSDIPKRG